MIYPRLGSSNSIISRRFDVTNFVDSLTLIGNHATIESTTNLELYVLYFMILGYNNAEMFECIHNMKLRINYILNYKYTFTIETNK